MGAVADLFRERRFVEAIPLLELAIARTPTDWRLFADLTVAQKHAHDFAAVRAAGLRAIELGAPADEEGMHWNLGIAATALGDWALARRSWLACRVPLDDGTGPIAGRFGIAPVRVALDTAPEVVWCARLCPARARIHSIPLPDSGRRFGDVVLHDGEPRGERSDGRRTYSVFDELVLLERSVCETFVLELDATGPGDVEALRASLGDVCAELEDWTEALVFHCKACSEGRLDGHTHEGEREPTWQPRRNVAVATAGEITDAALEAWERGAPGRKVHAVLGG